MNIRVIIDKLGPIQNSEIEFKPFLVYTGESGLGKSYTALLWYNLLTAMTSERLSEFIRMKSNGSQKDELALKFKDFRTWLNQNTSAYLGYLLGNTNFDCAVNYVFEGIDDEMGLLLRRQNYDLVNGFCRYAVNEASMIFPEDMDSKVMMSIILSSYLTDKCLGIALIQPLILPPARAAFMGANTTSPIGMYRDFLQQFLVMDMLARCCNKGMLIQMTTHSDYMLGRMNQLLLLGKIKQASEASFGQFCEAHLHNKNLYLTDLQVGAYYFKREEGKVVIEKQDLAEGLPFSSFEHTVKDQMDLSADISEVAEQLGIVSNL
ncbi:hypothetical protein ACTNCZ_14380 [Segatella copri]|uniref:hypothetical protein n=1 Tax=Segatella copri TaxID=165179 RepID=UPI003F8A1E51